MENPLEAELRALVFKGAQLLGMSVISRYKNDSGIMRCDDCGAQIHDPDEDGYLVHVDGGQHGCPMGEGCAHASEWVIEFEPTLRSLSTDDAPTSKETT